MENQKLQELEKRLKAHDWRHDMSEDQNVWDAGQKDEKQIKALAKELGPEGEQLLKQYEEKCNG